MGDLDDHMLATLNGLSLHNESMHKLTNPEDQRMYIESNYKSLSREDLINVFSCIVDGGQKDILRENKNDVVFSLDKVSDENICRIYCIMYIIVEKNKSLAKI